MEEDSSIIAWVYGSSGAGKETFIRYLAKKPSKNLVQKLGWENKKIKVIASSIKHVAQHENDPAYKGRWRILDEVEKVSKQKNVVLLIKGQDVDLENKIPTELQKRFKEHTHQIIFLHTKVSTLLQRWKKKKWFDKKYQANDVKKWLRYQLKFLLKLKRFKIISLDSGERKSYRKIRFPPKI